jgi:hypothetical protein
MCEKKYPNMPRIISKIPFLLLLFFVNVVEADMLNQDYEVTIEGHYTDNSKSFCKDWRITEGDVKLFFSKASQVSFEMIHQEFDWLPCYASGKIIDKSKIYTWTIRLIGIGTLSTSDGKTITFGCKNCDEIF